jgi:phosphinothricin acetyltransferase
MTTLLIQIREAIAEDFESITSIYRHYVLKSSGTFEEVPPDINEMLIRFKSIKNLGLPYLIAESEGEVLGYCYAGFFRTRSAYRYTIEDSIYVAPNVNRRGIGTSLLRELVIQTTKMGYRQMIAMIGDSANLSSINLHRKLGFRQEGVLRGVGLKFNRWVDVVVMHRELASLDSPLPKTQITL